jgi:hypothetical protein
MWPFPKMRFEWKEPKESRRTLAAVEATKERWWHKPLAGAVVACLLMAGWGLAKLDPKKNPPPLAVVAPLALPAGLFLVYFTTWLHGVAPTTVRVFDKRLVRINGPSRVWERKEIRSFAIRDCGDFHVLVLESHKGAQSLLGVPLEVEVRALEDLFRGWGLTRARPDSPSHE